MKQIRLFFIAAITLMPVCLGAKPVGQEIAKQVAEAQLRSRIQLRSDQIQELNLVYVLAWVNTTGSNALGAPSDVLYYVFNAGDKGFVIVSGDDIAVPILAYSNDGAYNPDDLSPNFVYWMDGLANGIKDAIVKNLPQSEKAKGQWEELLSGKGTTLRAFNEDSGSGTPLLDIEGIKWNQGTPYNDSCPKIDDCSERSVTGCVATAMAQIMRYHKYPEYGKGTIPGYFTSTRNVEIEDTDIDGFYYDWENMLPVYNFYAGTLEQKAAVANLMYHCGKSVKMDYYYTCYSSGAYSEDVPRALTAYFNYDKSIQFIYRYSYSDDEWETLLKSQIDIGLPIYYSGSSETSGHAFVCDGYDDEDLFHFNWGWGGGGSYCALNAVNGYDYNQDIIINIKPDEGGKPFYKLLLYSFNIYDNTTVKKNEIFRINLGVFMTENAMNYEFEGEVGVAIVNEQDKILNVIGKVDAKIMYSFSSQVPCYFPVDTEAGVYKLKTVIRETGEEEWTVVTANPGIYDFIEMTVEDGIAAEPDIFLYPTFTFNSSLIYQGLPLSVNFGLYNPSSTDGHFYGEFDLGLYNSINGELVELIEKRNLFVLNGYSNPFTFLSNQITAPPGDYVLTLYQKNIISGEKKKAANYGSYMNDLPVTIHRVTWTGSENEKWDTEENWSSGQVPGKSLNVAIAGEALNFPILEEPVEVAEIHFEPGAQIGNQSLLNYEKAFVQYDLSDSKRERWNMLAIPLGQVVPGDFVFGGYPTTWVRTFTTYLDGTITKGGWVTAAGGSVVFSTGDGFVIWLNADGGANDAPGKGLKRLGGILELPYFERNDRLQINHAHDYAGNGTGSEILGTSTFYNFQFNGSEYVRNEIQNYNVIRKSTAYEIAKGNVSMTPEFADGSFALIGNPFMAALDFDEFCKDPANASTIKGIYHVWVDDAYESYSTELGKAFGKIGTIPLDKYIAPLQGFIVEKNDESPSPSSQFRYTIAQPELTFNDSWAKVNNEVVLRSSANAGNILDIVALNPVAGVRTLITKREGGQNEFGNLDSRKIINGINEVPEIYTLKPYKDGLVAVAINVVNNDDLLIPVGLATNYMGDITFTFSGMDNYDAALTLIDAETNQTINLTGLASCDYTFNYTPKTINGEAAVCEDRFFIRISKSATGLMETIAEKVNVFESNGLIRIVSGATNPVKEVALYDLQGMLLYKEAALNTISYTVDKSFPAGTYIVKVVSEKNTDNVKLIK